MRILKYIFLLILLALIAVTVYVATQKGEYNIEGSRIIKSPKTAVFSYVNDLRNWRNWNTADDAGSDLKISYSPVSVGAGSSLSWQHGESDGTIRTLYVKEGDSIVREVVRDGLRSKIIYTFSDTDAGTKVSWNATGRLDFVSKIYATLQGGAATVARGRYEQNLSNLDRILDYEINTYSITLDGFTEKDGAMYLKQTINSKIENASRNTRIMVANLQRFVTENKIGTNGKPFVIYHSYDASAGLTKFSVCMPITEEIYTLAGSDITFANLEPFYALKLTLKGDYSHRQEAWAKGRQYLTDGNYQRVPDPIAVEVVQTAIGDTKRPSEWVTHIYLPVRRAAPSSQPTPTVATQRPRPAIAEDVPATKTE